LLRRPAAQAPNPLHPQNCGPKSAQNASGQWVGTPTVSSWLFVTPTALRETLVWLDRRYSVGGRKVGGVDLQRAEPGA
jgi:hypothetical protein